MPEIETFWEEILSYDTLYDIVWLFNDHFDGFNAQACTADLIHMLQLTEWYADKILVLLQYDNDIVFINFRIIWKENLN